MIFRTSVWFACFFLLAGGGGGGVGSGGYAFMNLVRFTRPAVSSSSSSSSSKTRLFEWPSSLEGGVDRVEALLEKLSKQSKLRQDVKEGCAAGEPPNDIPEEMMPFYALGTSLEEEFRQHISPRIMEYHYRHPNLYIPYYVMGKRGLAISKMTTADEKRYYTMGFQNVWHGNNTLLNDTDKWLHYNDKVNNIFKERISAFREKNREPAEKLRRAFLNKYPNASDLGYGVLYQETVTGNGAPSTDGDFAVVEYCCYWANGTCFETAYGPWPGQPNETPLFAGARGLLLAYDEMREGSEAAVYLPGDMAYGDYTDGHHLLPGEAITMEVTLQKLLPSTPQRQMAVKKQVILQPWEKAEEQAFWEAHEARVQKMIDEEKVEEKELSEKELDEEDLQRKIQEIQMF